MDSNRHFSATVVLAAIVAWSTGSHGVRAQQPDPGNPASAESVESTADQIYALAATFYADQNWQAASEQFRLLIDQHPGHDLVTNATFYLGESLVQLNRNAEAEQVFTEFVNQKPDSGYAARARFRLAECKYLNREFAEARQRFDKFMAENGSQPLAEFALPYLGELHLRFGDVGKSRQAYEEALRRFPESGLSDKCRLGLAQALHRQGNDAEASRFYRFLADQPGNPLADDARLMLGKTFAEQGDWNRAGTEFERIIREYPNSELRTEATYLLAKRDMVRGNWSGSWQRLQPLLQETVDDELFVRMGLDAAIVAVRVDELDRARDLIDKIKNLELNPSATEFAMVVEIDIANREKDLPQLEKRVAGFEKRFADSVHITRCIEPLARLHYDRGQFAKAADRYRQLVDLVTRRPDLAGNLPAWRYLLGLSRIGTGEYAIATRQLKAIRDFGNNVPFQAATSFAIGTALSGQEKFAESIPWYQQYLTSQPGGDDGVRCHADLAVAQVKTGQLAQAVRTLEKVLEKNAANKSVLGACELIAESALKNRDRKTATRFFQVLARSEHPEFAARGANGLMWADDESTLSAENLQSVIATGADPDLALEAVLGRVQQWQADGKHQQTVNILKDIVQLHSGSPHLNEARFRLAISRQRMGGKSNSQAAVSLLEEFLREQPDADLADLARYELAWARHDSGDPAAACEMFAEIADRYPESDYRIDSCYRAALLLRESGDEAKTVQRLRQMLEWDPDHALAGYAHYALGELASQREQWQEAIGHFNAVVEKTTAPGLLNPAKYWLAESLYQSDQLEKAESLFRSLRNVEFSEPELRPVIGLRLAQIAARNEDWVAVERIVHQQRGDSDEASDSWQLDYLKGRVYMSQARFRQARQMFGHVLRHPQAAGTRTAAMSQWMVGESWFHQQDYKQALRAYLLVDSLYDFAQWRSLALLQAAKCHVHLGDSRQAIKTCRRMLKTFPDSSHAAQARTLIGELTAANPEQTKQKHIPANWSRQER